MKHLLLIAAVLVSGNAGATTGQTSSGAGEALLIAILACCLIGLSLLYIKQNRDLKFWKASSEKWRDKADQWQEVYYRLATSPAVDNDKYELHLPWETRGTDGCIVLKCKEPTNDN